MKSGSLNPRGEKAAPGSPRPRQRKKKRLKLVRFEFEARRMPDVESPQSKRFDEHTIVAMISVEATAHRKRPVSLALLMVPESGSRNNLP